MDSSTDAIIAIVENEKQIRKRLELARRQVSMIVVYTTELNVIRGEKIKEIKRLYFAEKLKQKEIARIAGVTQGTVSKLISESYKK